MLNISGGGETVSVTVYEKCARVYTNKHNYVYSRGRTNQVASDENRSTHASLFNNSGGVARRRYGF